MLFFSACSTLDVAFTFDESDSFTGPFNTATAFAADLVSEFSTAISNDEVRFAATTFHVSVTSQFDFQTYNTGNAISTALGNIQAAGGGTSISVALNHLRNDVFTSGTGARSQASKVAFVFTDGYGGSVTTSASLLHSECVTVYAIGIGTPNSYSTLADIASSSDKAIIIADSSMVTWRLYLFSVNAYLKLCSNANSSCLTSSSTSDSFSSSNTVVIIATIVPLFTLGSVAVVVAAVMYHKRKLCCFQNKLQPEPPKNQTDPADGSKTVTGITESHNMHRGAAPVNTVFTVAPC